MKCDVELMFSPSIKTKVFTRCSVQFFFSFSFYYWNITNVKQMNDEKFMKKITNSLKLNIDKSIFRIIIRLMWLHVFFLFSSWFREKKSRSIIKTLYCHRNFQPCSVWNKKKKKKTFRTELDGFEIRCHTLIEKWKVSCCCGIKQIDNVFYYVKELSIW